MSLDTALQLTFNHHWEQHQHQLRHPEINGYLEPSRIKPPRIPFFSNVTGDWIKDKEAADVNYWAQHDLQPGAFAQGIRSLVQRPGQLFIEVGHSPVSDSSTEINAVLQSHMLAPLPRTGRSSDVQTRLLEMVAKLWLLGCQIDWKEFYRGKSRRRIPLPSYPFERTRYWVGPKNASEVSFQEVAAAARGEHPAEVPKTPEAVRTSICQFLESLLGVAQISNEDDFFELGGDSIVGLQLASRIKGLFNIEFSLEEFLDRPTVGSLVEMVIDRMIGGNQTAPEQEDAAAVQHPAITKAERGNEAPLSFAQQRMWFLHELDSGSTPYNEHVFLKIKGPVNVRVLEESFKEIIRRQQGLRTIFIAKENGPVQVLLDSPKFTLNVVNLTRDPEPEREPTARQLALHSIQQPFDLSCWPLFRVGLVQTGKDEHLLLIVAHHIIFDGWSIGVLFQELGAIYEAFLVGRPSPLLELPVQYADFAIWQRNWLQGDVLENHLAYWRKQLAGELPLLELPSDRPRTGIRTTQGAREPIALPGRLVEGLQRVAREERATVFMALLAAFYTLLYRYTSNTDLLVGTPVANRTNVEIEELIGFFANTLVLRGDLSGDPTFRNFLQQVRIATLQAQAHQDLPFEKLVDELRPERSLSRTPLFQAMLILQNIPVPTHRSREWEVSMVPLHGGSAKFELALSLMEGREGELTGALEYSTDLFNADRISRMRTHFSNLLEAIVADPDQRLSQLAMLSAEERSQVLTGWNSNVIEPRPNALHRLFEAQVERTPVGLAMIFEGQEWTYLELNERANRIAHRLIEFGIGPGKVVGLALERSPHIFAAVLGIFKSGGAYVPLDLTHPAARQALIIQDAQVELLLSQTSVKERLDCFGLQQVCVDEIEEHNTNMANPPNSISPEDLAYVIYTSGSTGRPKGVAITHGGLSNLVAAQGQIFSISTGERILQLASINFDAAVWDMAMALPRGGCLVMLGTEILAGGELESAMRHYGVNIAALPPSVLQIASEKDLPDLRTVIAFGEVCDEPLVARWGMGRDFRNGYGPTEATVGETMSSPLRLGSKPGIGRPFANTQVYILDDAMQPLPVGVGGEMYIGGAGLARGYLNHPQLTAEKFVPNPFSHSGERLYRTGDRGCWRADGTLEFLGRIDHQVKLRGLRIELGEIDSCLQRHPAVSRAAAIVHQAPGGQKQLVAYLELKAELALDIQKLKAHLRESLPEYMVPSAFVSLTEMPLTANGKVNRQKLPAPETELVEDLYEAPTSPQEHMLAAIWEEVLGRQRIGVHHNFFDLGGHSLLLVQLIARVRQRFGVELPLRTVFGSPTLGALAAAIQRENRKNYPGQLCLKPVSREQDLPLTYQQERVWLIHQLRPGNAAYNLCFGLRLRGELNIRALRHALEGVIARHEILRTTFSVRNNKPIQIIGAPFTPAIEQLYVDAANDTERETAALRLATAIAAEPFELRSGPLLRTKLIHLERREHLLVVTLHHIVSDGWSAAIFVRDLLRFYEAELGGHRPSLAELPIQYADFSCWQRSYVESGAVQDHLTYWKQSLAGRPEVLSLPTDMPRSAMQGFHGGCESLDIAPELTGELRAFAKQNSATLFTLLLAVFEVLLYRYSGQDDLVIAIPTANRTQLATEDLIGSFVNALPLRVRVSPELSFADLLRHVQETVLQAQMHQNVPFEKLVEELQIVRDLSRTPLFQTMFALQNVPVLVQPLSDVDVSWVRIHNGTSKFDLSLSMVEGQDGGISGILEYNTDLFYRERIRRMAGHFQQLLRAVCSGESAAPVSRLWLLSENEREQLLPPADIAREEVPGLSVHSLFEAHVRKAPEALAMSFQDRRMTYFTLNYEADQLASELRKHGVGPEALVALSLEDPMKAAIALLAVLKTGAACFTGERLPLHGTGNPDFVITDQEIPSSASVLSRTQIIRWASDHASGSVEKAPGVPCEVVSKSGAWFAAHVDAQGEPGLMMSTHWDLYSELSWMQREFSVTSSDRVLVVPAQTGTWSREMLLPLITGAELVLAAPKECQYEDDLAVLVNTKMATIVFCSPLSFLLCVNAQQNTCPSLRHIICVGEPVSASVCQRLASLCGDVHALYAPTQAAAITHWRYQQQAGIESSIGRYIGKPLPDVRAYVLDARMAPVPAGVAGQLYVGRVRARAQINPRELGAERYVADPFSPRQGAVLYRTGERARWRFDGTLELLAFVQQAKGVRKFTFEPSEVEIMLERHPAVQRVVLGLSEEDGALTAYVLLAQDAAVTGSELRQFVQGRLPVDAVPTAFSLRKRMPLNATGRIDRMALLADQPNKIEKPDFADSPQTSLECELVSIWEDLLEIPSIGTNDNFFALGGHSLLALRLIGTVEKCLKKSVSLSAFVENPTITHLAFLVSSEGLPQKSLVSLKSSGDAHPLFLVHPAGGNVTCYLDLANYLPKGRPLYGLQAVGWENAASPDATIEAMAERYLQEVKAVQPRGPYFLGGWSMGGLVAFEMAGRMRSDGEEIGGLVMFDTSFPVGRTTAGCSADDLVRSFGFQLGLFSAPTAFVENGHTLEIDEVLSNAVNEADRRGAISSDITPEIAKRLFQVFRAHVAAAEVYVPRPYSGSITLFKARERSTIASRTHLAQDLVSKWHSVCDNVHVYSVKGNHYTMLREPYAKAVSNQLQKRFLKKKRVRVGAV
jgi:amino acid adenylation domain-containing protein